MIAQDKRFGIVSPNNSVTKQETVYVIYVVTTPEKMWTALTDGELSKKYFFERAWRATGKSARPSKCGNRTARSIAGGFTV
jgi:uncharacterized protein YndB with AHSA1/START domain